MNIEDIVFNGINEIDLNTEVTDFKEFQIKLVVKFSQEKYKQYYNLYSKMLEKKYNGDYVPYSLHIVKQYLKRNKVYSVKNNIYNINEITINSLEITLSNKKKLIINVPLSYTEQYNGVINNFLKEIGYNTIKKKSIDGVYESAFNYYTSCPVDNLIIFDSETSTNVEYYLENKKDNNKSLYVFSNKKDNKDILLMIIEDFIKNNELLIDKLNNDRDNNKTVISFSNGKTLEISDEKIFKKIDRKIDVLTDNLIAKKIKILKKP